MTDKTDFSMLYRELGVEPEAGIDAFHRAYRHSLRRLHPDTRNCHDDGETVDLAWLVHDYRRALAFHNAHGRLPGMRDPEVCRSPVETQQRHHVPPPVLPVPESLSGAGPLLRLMQILVDVTMVVIGVGLLLS